MKQSRPSIERIAQLQKLIADFSNIQRMLNLGDTGRRENDVEHSYGLALTCWFIAPKIAPELDLKKILMYALAHDIVEVHSGDTYVFDTELVKTKEAREDAALEQLREEWPDFSELIDAAEDYKYKRNEEAKFVYTIDKLLPPILINIGEKAEFYKKHKVTREMHEAEKRKKMTQSQVLLPYTEELIEWMTNSDYFYKSE